MNVDQSFPDCERLVKLVELYVDAKFDDTSTRIMSRKAKRMALIVFVTGAFLGSAAVFIGLETREGRRTDALLAQKGIPWEGELVRRFIAPNDWTRRIEYRVAGSGVKNVEVHPAVWDQLEHAKTVPVAYVPDEPDVDRLLFGEVKDDDFTKTPKADICSPRSGA